MKKISIDIETFSAIDLKSSGVYRYAEDDSFEILLFAYSVDEGEVLLVDLARGEQIPSDIIAALSDETVEKWAFNAQFERVCLSNHLGHWLAPRGWHCSMVWSATLGLPLSLDSVGAVLGLEKQKFSTGKSLISYFCKPCSPTKINAGRFRNLPRHEEGKWQQFKEYNVRDVETEQEVQKKLAKFPVPLEIWKEYWIDQQINDLGIAIDQEFVKQAIRVHEQCKETLTARMVELTGLENPNSVQQLSGWLKENGLEMPSLDKKSVEQALKTAPPHLTEVLHLRQQLSKSSVKKYTAMENCVCKDSRAHGMFQFYGANRTGRWSGRLIQLQNLAQNHMTDLAEARSLVRTGDFNSVSMLYDNIPVTLSELIRTAFVPRDGSTFLVADFSAIEARVIAWVAGEKWRMKVFAEGGDIYCASASQMFKVPVEKHGQNSHLRQKGKQAELACIAEGSLVLTDKGLIPIQDVKLHHKVWDGEAWVSHEGVVYRGEKEVIEYEGLTATPDHLVWVQGSDSPITFAQAITNQVPLRKTDTRAIAVIPDGRCKVYDIKNAGKHHRFTVSNVLVHNCGYGGSKGALISMGALDFGMKEEELQPLVTAWREANPNITKLWWDVDRAAKDCVKQRATTQTHGIKFSYKSGFMFITLPSGRKLAYVRPRIGENKFGGECVTYEGVGENKKWLRLDSYGPKFVENCIAEDELVLTNRGLVKIQDVKLSDRLWDGISWVEHEGVIDNGMQETISVNGVRMTQEHKILTSEGWIKCYEASGFDWAKVQLPHCYRKSKKHKARKSTVALQMRLWSNGCGVKCKFTRSKEPKEVMWLHDKKVNRGRKQNPRIEQTPCVCCVEKHETKMYNLISPSLPQLRGARNRRLRGMARQLHPILGGYGRRLSKWTAIRPNRQQQRVLPRKLQMDRRERKYEKPSKRTHSSVSSWKNVFSRIGGTFRNRRNNTALQNKKWVATRVIINETRCQKQVYDIRNCGPRHRFTIYKNGELFIVSNCVQALARDLLMYAIGNLSHCRIVAHVHDELIIESEDGITLDMVCEKMGEPPPWAKGLLLGADGYECLFYKKD